MTTITAPYPDLLPGRHGGDVEHIARTLGVDPTSLLDLSASLNPVAPDITPLISAHLPSIHRYPDAAAATRLMAESLGVDAEEVLLTNGGSEAISLLAAEIGGRVSEPEFSLHPRQPRDSRTESPAPLWRSNPHNPSGRLAAPNERADVWDEAFYPLATGRWTKSDPDALATVGSLTKVFACPGLRLGYVVAPPDLLARLRASQPEWSVSTLALAVLPDLLQQAADHLADWATRIAELRTRLVTVLTNHGLSCEPSDANFVLCHSSDRGLRRRLLDHGVIIRDCTSFGLPDHVRIAVPDELGLARLARALCGPRALQVQDVAP
jgi:histidinol-phosphate/aromatic aminotransferase/cobyric acid decarboxylase-like protein